MIEKIKKVNKKNLEILKTKKVLVYYNNVFLNKYDSVSQVSKKLNLKRDVVLSCLKGNQQTYKGYIFKYL